jgi:LuxR family maltose regulon positive regulatory protein
MLETGAIFIADPPISHVGGHLLGIPSEFIILDSWGTPGLLRENVPKRAQNMLIWLAEREAYELREGDHALPALDPAWSRWLGDHGSFSFHGRHGQLHLLKERRKAGPGYWYAYRRQGAQIAKRYAGRSGELTFARLEALAQALAATDQKVVGGQPQQRLVERAADAGHAAATSLLTPKLQPPRLHRSLVRRQRLLALLDAGRERKLTLLSAPAGFGKTTLVRQWLAEAAAQGKAPVLAWLALDPGDNDPLRFWRYLITACRTLSPEIGVQSLALVETPVAIKSPLDMILTAFVNELAQVAHESILVLEDYHVITTPQIHEIVGLLLEHLPRHLHLLIITRAHPPLPLARLAASGELTEIEAPELRFSDAETAAFLRQSTALPLQPGDVALIETHIEGWAAGLRLLALALEGRDDPSEIGRIVEHFIAGRRGIGEYFVAEVLNSQPEQIQLFLLQTSFLARLTASLCDSVTEGTSSQATLETLDQANLFIEPLDGSGLWYRYHALFATAMQNEARRRLGDAAVRDLLERAGRWYEAHGLQAEAIETAFLSGDLQRAADLLEVAVGPQFLLERPVLNGPPEFYTLQRWLTRLPRGMLNERPLLNLALAVAMLFISIVDMQPAGGSTDGEIEQLFAQAERGFKIAGETGRLGQVFTFRALLLRERGEVAAAVGWSQAALEVLPPLELSLRSICLGVVGVGEQSAGSLSRAVALFTEAQAMCAQLDNRQFVRANAVMLGWALLEQNELNRAALLFRQILAEARLVGDLDDIAHTLLGLAEIALYWNDLDAAWAQAEEVMAIRHQHPHAPDHIYAALIQARVEQARGQSAAALARCARLLTKREPAFVPSDRSLVAQIAFEQARIALADGDLAAALGWRATRPTDLELPRIQCDREGILLARLRIAEGDPAAAVQLLEPLLANAEAGGRGQAALEARVSLALAYAAAGQPRAARQTLVAALVSARPANAQHVLIAEGESLAGLLRASLPALADTSLRTFAKTILRGGSSAEGAPGAGLLSAQEQRVLRLIAAGRNNSQIAADLVVSVNTVKVHIKNIYRKLSVNSRLEAANAARDLGLIQQ